MADIVEMTCLECRKVKMVNKWFGVCEDCFKTEVLPLIAVPNEPKEG